MSSPFEYDASRPDCDTEPYVWRRPDDNGITLVIIDDKMAKFGVCEQLAPGWLEGIPLGQVGSDVMGLLDFSDVKPVETIKGLIKHLSERHPSVTKVVLSDFPHDEEPPQWLSSLPDSSWTFFVDLFDEREDVVDSVPGGKVIHWLLEARVPKRNIAILSMGTTNDSFLNDLMSIEKSWPGAKSDIDRFFGRWKKTTWDETLWPDESENWFNSGGEVPHDCPHADSTGPKKAGYEKIDEYIKRLTGEPLPSEHCCKVYDAAKTLVGSFASCDTRSGEDGHDLTCGALALLLAFGQFQETETAADWIARLNWMDTEEIVTHPLEDKAHRCVNHKIVSHLMEELWPVLLKQKEGGGESTVRCVELAENALQITLGFDGNKICDHFEGSGGGRTTRALRHLRKLIVGNGTNGGVETGGVDVRVVDGAQTRVTIYAPGGRP